MRGAPAIAVLGCLSLAVDISSKTFDTKEQFMMYVAEKLDYLVSARPTAVNIAKAAAELKAKLALYKPEGLEHVQDLKSYLIKEIEGMLQKDIDDNVKIGSFGRDHIMSSNADVKVKVLTHCNTGSLATVKYGTALGVIRCLHEKGMLLCVAQGWCYWRCLGG